MAVSTPAVIDLARQLRETLSGTIWAIGGSTLLHRLGLEDDPHDLDIVTTPAQFDVVAARLASRFGAAERPSHDVYHSTHFARFQSTLGPSIDLMAGIRVAAHGRTVEWPFDPQRIDIHDGLPYMRAEDWLVLYALFQRPARVAQLAAHLALGR